MSARLSRHLPCFTCVSIYISVSAATSGSHSLIPTTMFTKKTKLITVITVNMLTSGCLERMDIYPTSSIYRCFDKVTGKVDLIGSQNKAPAETNWSHVELQIETSFLQLHYGKGTKSTVCGFIDPNKLKYCWIDDLSYSPLCCSSRKTNLSYNFGVLPFLYCKLYKNARCPPYSQIWKVYWRDMKLLTTFQNLPLEKSAKIVKIM